MISRIVGSRRAVFVVLLVIAAINIITVAHHEASAKVLNAKEGLDKMIDKVMSTEYSAALKEDLLSTKESELLNEVKAQLREEQRAQVLKDLKAELRKGVTDQHVAELNVRLMKAVTENYFSARSLNGDYLGELKREYFAQHKDALRDSVFYEALNEVLIGAPGVDELKKKVSDKIKENFNRQPWFEFVLKNIIIESAPKLGPLTEEERGKDLPAAHFCINPHVYSKEYLLKGVKLSHERFQDFKTSHTTIVDKLNALGAPPPHMFTGRGIIISGGGEYMAGALVAIVQAREMGSKLPIELIINDDSEYDEYVCKTLGPKFKFRCLNLERELGKDLIRGLGLKKFQLKIVGLLASSFDEVISLDADNMAIKNPDDLFASTPYVKTGFLMWPDMWHRAISPIYYNFAKIQAGEVVKRYGIENERNFRDYVSSPPQSIHFHDLENLPSTVSAETGQMVFSKSQHYKSLILALYYNVYGVTHYWRLFHQGTPGEGDRETFVPALHVFNEPYHMVDTSVWLAGFTKEDGGFQETTIVQYDPESSWEFAWQWRHFLQKKGLDSRMWFSQDTARTKELLEEFRGIELAPPDPDVFFLHVHRPKINPILATSPDGYFEWNKQRNLGKPGAYTQFGTTDWDLKFYTIGEWVACKGIKSDEWWKRANRKQEDVCKEYSEYVKFLKKDSKDSNAQKFYNVQLQ